MKFQEFHHDKTDIQDTKEYKFNGEFSQPSGINMTGVNVSMLCMPCYACQCMLL